MNKRSFILVVIVLLMGVSAGLAQQSLHNTRADRYFRDGQNYLEKGNYNAARDAFEQYLAVSDDPSRSKDAEYYRAYSALVLYHNDGELLVNDFITSNPTHPKASLANYELGNFYYNERNYAKAARYLSRVDAASLDRTRKLEAQFKLAYSYFSERNFEEALKYFNVIKRQESRYTAAANYYAGYIAYERQDYDNALIDLQKAGRDPAYESVVPSMICNVYYAREDYDELIGYGSEVLEQRGVRNRQDILLLTAEAHFFRGEYTEAAALYSAYRDAERSRPRSEVLFRAGFSHFQLGNYEAAIEDLKLVAGVEGETGYMASYYLGLAYIETNNPRFALNAFDKVIKQGEGEVKEEAAFLYGKINFEILETSAAIQSLEAFVAAYPGSDHFDEANDLLGEAYLNSNNYNDAIRHIESLEQMTPGLKKAYQRATYLKGVEFFNKGDFPQAVRMFDRSLENRVEGAYTVRAAFWKAEAYSIGRMYDTAIDAYMEVLNDPARETDDLDVASYYGLGYAYYNNKIYDQALIYFRKFVESASEDGSGFYDDALVRLADCFYATRNYGSALRYYERVLNTRHPDMDYAILQTGIISAIQGNEEQAEVNLNRVINEYPDSRYYVNALFELGDFYLQQGEYQRSIRQFTQIIDNKPKSPFRPYALLKRATAYYNMGNYNNVIDNYVSFLDQYPKHAESSNALLGLQEALSLSNRLDEFDAYLTAYKEANPDQEGLEAVEFETARNQYFNQNYEKAIRSFNAFIDTYPNDVNVFESRYYIAESYYRLGQVDQALTYYNEVLAENKISNINRVVDRIAELEFQEGRYENALYFYQQLAGLALTKKQEYTAWSGLMKSHYILANYDSVEYYGNLILEKGLVSANAQTTALVFLGKSKFARGDYEGAIEAFNRVKDVAQDENAAEAQYMIAEIAFNREDYEGSLDRLYELHQEFSAFTIWYDRSFLLIADNFAAMEEYFQATETLNSLIENTGFDEIKDQAEYKLKLIREQEAETLSQPEDTVTVPADTIPMDNNEGN